MFCSFIFYVFVFVKILYIWDWYQSRTHRSKSRWFRSCSNSVPIRSCVQYFTSEPRSIPIGFRFQKPVCHWFGQKAVKVRKNRLAKKKRTKMQNYVDLCKICKVFLFPYHDVTLWNKQCLYAAHTRFDPFPNKPWYLGVCRKSLLKTLWEKEKLLVTSNFSFSHSVFYLFGELLRHFHQV